MTPQQFIDVWKNVKLTERAACQSHFVGLCDVLGVKRPADADPDGTWYTFEKYVSKVAGKKGYADVWLKDHFGWEYKGPHKNLDKAYDQLLQYREALGNPPILIVCDMNRFVIHTNFTGTIKEVHEFDLDGFADPKNREKLLAAFKNPEELRPGRTQKQLTEEVAHEFVALAEGLRQRNLDPHLVGHFLMRLMFCMFAEDIGLLPKDLFLDLVRKSGGEGAALSKRLRDLFRAMGTQGQSYGNDDIPWFNGGLFADEDVIELQKSEIKTLVKAAEHDWANIEPSIFGTLFERILDPAKRSELGANYTSKEDIEALLGPVMVTPLRQEWAAVRSSADAIWETVEAKADARRKAPKKVVITRRNEKVAESKEMKAFRGVVNGFLYRLSHATVLDPACGSGNFLYVALHALLDLEKEVIAYSNAHNIPVLLPGVRPGQLHGIEISPYAQELAQVVIWIGYLQWMKFNGFVTPRDPILDPMRNIENRDAILDRSDPARPKSPEWPDAEFIVGNPPFLGSRKMRKRLGDEYVGVLHGLYDGKVPNGADLCCYWFHLGIRAANKSRSSRVGLLATQAIRQGASQKVVSRVIKETNVFFVISDRPWQLDGAKVRTSMIGYTASPVNSVLVDGQERPTVNPDLTSGTDVTRARRLEENLGIGFQAVIPSGNFLIDDASVMDVLTNPNPHLRPNSDAVRPWIVGKDLTDRPRFKWIVDFGVDRPEKEAALYEAPFAVVTSQVLPARSGRVYDHPSNHPLWQFWNARPEMRAALGRKRHYIATSRVAKHRFFCRVGSETLADARLIIFAADDYYSLGVLSSSCHLLWADRLKTCHGDGKQGGRPTYKVADCFETFPFPEARAAERAVIAAAAEELDRLRSNWLNPPEWTRTEVLEFPGSVTGPWGHYVVQPNADGIGTVRYPRTVPRGNADEVKLKARTMTKLYNDRPAWLKAAHGKLDEAVLDAYGWSPSLHQDDILDNLLELNLARQPASGADEEGDEDDEDGGGGDDEG